MASPVSRSRWCGASTRRPFSPGSQEGEIVLLPPLGYSPTGEVFNLDADDVATAVAIALRAGKLIFLIDAAGVVDEAGGLIRQLTVEEAEAAIAQDPSSQDPSSRTMRAPARAVRATVRHQGLPHGRGARLSHRSTPEASMACGCT